MRARIVAAVTGTLAAGLLAAAPAGAVSAAAAPAGAAAPVPRAGGYAFVAHRPDTVSATVRVAPISCTHGRQRTISVGLFGTYVIERTRHGHTMRTGPHGWYFTATSSCRGDRPQYALLFRGYNTPHGRMTRLHAGQVVELQAQAGSWYWDSGDQGGGAGAFGAAHTTPELQPRSVAGVRLVRTRSPRFETLISNVKVDGRRLRRLHPQPVRERKHGAVVVRPGPVRADGKSFTVRVG